MNNGCYCGRLAYLLFVSKTCVVLITKTRVVLISYDCLALTMYFCCGNLNAIKKTLTSRQLLVMM